MNTRKKPSAKSKPQKSGTDAAKSCQNGPALSAYEAATAKPNDAEKEAFITRYMATVSDDAPGEIARLAASMAPPAKAFDSAALTAQAIAIREESAIAIAARRAALLAGADWFSLNGLWHRIAADRPKAETDRDTRLVAIIAAMMARNEEYSRRYNADPQRAEEHAAEDALLAKVEKESGALPKVPCLLETALRWSISAPDRLPWKVIEGAFVDFLTVCEAQEQHQREGVRRRQDAEDWIERHRQVLLNQNLTNEQRHHHVTELAEHEATIAELDAIAACASNFQPGTPAFPALTAEAKATYATYRKRKTAGRDNLLFLASDFRAFCHQHAYAEKWLKVHQAQSAAAESTNSKRNPKYWSDESIRSLVQQFTAKFPHEKRTLENARAFSISGRDVKDAGEILGTLFALRGTPLPEAISSVMETLAHARWRAVTETAKGSTAGTTKRKKSGRKRAAHKGITASEDILRECLRLLE